MTNIRVALRVRPLSQREIDGNFPVVVAVDNNSAFITDIRVPERPSADSRQRFRQFDFDHTFWFSTSSGPCRNSARQHEIYQEMGPHLEKAILAGYNACLLAYGQSGSGKTHTMIGTRDDPGIIPRLCHSLWEKLKVAHPLLPNGQPSFRMEVSFLEIYREKVKDLLNPEKSLKLREHPQLGPHVQGLTRLEVTGEISLLDLLWEGERRRATGNTSSNRRSSRSHAIWTLYLTVHNEKSEKEAKKNDKGIIISSGSDSGSSCNDMSSSAESSSNRSSLEPSGDGDASTSPSGYKSTTSLPLSLSSSSSSRSKGRIITNQVHLVDLAGSEKADCTTAKSLLAEGADINRSLVALGNVISALAEKAQYVPFRDSALTWLLKDSIGGNASTSIIITASPSSHCHAQTLNSLRFAQRARLVENTPKINLAPASYLGTGASPYGFLSVMSAMELKKDIGRLAKIIKSAQNIAFQATSWVFGRKSSSPSYCTTTTHNHHSTLSRNNPPENISPLLLQDYYSFPQSQRRDQALLTFSHLLSLSKFSSMLLDYPNLEQWRINNGGILRGLAPRANWTRLIHAIEGIGQAEQEQVKLQRERACSEDATGNGKEDGLASLASQNSPPSTVSLSSTPPASIITEGRTSDRLPSTSSSSSPNKKTTAAASKTKSLNDVMVQADRDLELSKRRHPLLNHLRGRNARQQSESALNTKSLSQSTPTSHQQTSSSTPTHSPTKIVGTEVFIPTSNSFKCLTWQQEEVQPVPKPLSSSSHSSLLSIEDGREDNDDDDDDTSSTLHSGSSNQQINQLKYMLEVHYPVTRNVDLASRISERIHGSINDEHYQRKTKLFPTSVKMDPNLATEAPTVQDVVPTLVNPQTQNPEAVFNQTASKVESKDLINKTTIQSNAKLVCQQAKEERSYLFPMKCKHFASVLLPHKMAVSPFESSDENEFEEPEEMNLNSLPVYRAVPPNVCESLQCKIPKENDEFCYFSAVESTLSQEPTMLISTSCDEEDEDASSSSYEDINMPTMVRPVNLIREFSKLSDNLDCEETLEILPLEEDEDSDNVFLENVAQVSLVVNEPMETADTIEILVEENPQLFMSENLLVNRETVINGVSDCKFRNYFAKELHQMERMGKQIKSLLQLTQRYNVVKPFLDEITNLQNSDHSKEDPEMDMCIERCSGWNVEVELKKVEKEISQLNKVLRTGIGDGDGVAAAATNYSYHHHHMSTSSNSTVNANESDSSEMEGVYGVGYAHRRNIPLLSGVGGAVGARGKVGLQQRPPLPIPVKSSVSQPCISSSSSNNASFGGGGGDVSNITSGKFTPNFYSTPMKGIVRAASRTDQWHYGGSVRGSVENEVLENKPNHGIASFRPHPAPPSLGQTQSLQSMQTFYRNPATSSSSIGGGAASVGGANFSGSNNKGLQYCPSNENISVSSSNMTSASTYNTHYHLDQESLLSGANYPLNIGHCESTRMFPSTTVDKSTAGRSFSKGISDSSPNFHPYHQYGNLQNSFNLDEIRSHRQMYEQVGSSNGTDHANPRFSYDPSHLHHRGGSHMRSASDSLDLCSCGDSPSKFSIGAGLPLLQKSSSRGQFSNFGGSTATSATDQASEYSSACQSLSQIGTPPPLSTGSTAFYPLRHHHHHPQIYGHHHHQHSKSLSSTGGVVGSSVDNLGRYLIRESAAVAAARSNSSPTHHDYHSLFQPHYHVQSLQSHLYKLPTASSRSNHHQYHNENF